jgi:hypothetical protein
MNYLDGKTDEDHLCAAAWNCLCAMWTEEKRPDLQDIPARKQEPQSCAEFWRGLCGSSDVTGENMNTLDLAQKLVEEYENMLEG